MAEWPEIVVLKLWAPFVSSSEHFLPQERDLGAQVAKTQIKFWFSFI